MNIIMKKKAYFTVVAVSLVIGLFLTIFRAFQKAAKMGRKLRIGRRGRKLAGRPCGRS